MNIYDTWGYVRGSVVYIIEHILIILFKDGFMLLFIFP